MLYAYLISEPLQTVKQVFDETLGVIPDYVLDSPVAKVPPSRGNIFENVHDLIPPSYKSSEPDLQYA